MIKELIVLLCIIGAVMGDALGSLYRDGYGRANPNALLNGFFPAWPVIILGVGGNFE
jgi:hypothetical protein